ncbi:MAG: hypothetical protein QOD83_3086 [Solirubrobacteraceae bacterium]|jgi:hypothetical protein|nr:hypothetical protein [Solirubrobacteraceae bacterium]
MSIDSVSKMSRPGLLRRSVAEGLCFAIVAGVYVAGPVAGATLGAFAYQFIRTPAPAA